ncbi:MAG: response regulator SirA [Dehalococcoidia bacterium]|nr:response regulator SirA [Dehalococcoidia bacterium]MBF8303729.1 response regulator SirA [Dehalococcoidia bacterium]
MTNEIKADSTLDCRGLLCPMPVVKTKLAIDDLQPGQILKVLSTDKGAKKDFPSFCAETGHSLVKAVEDKGVYTFFIKIKKA